MAMSCTVEAKATATNKAPRMKTHSREMPPKIIGPPGSSATPVNPSINTKSAICARTIHPRLRPSSGGEYRSIRGDQRNLKLQGAWARVTNPMVRMSMPTLAIQAGMAIQTRPSGIPEKNIWSVTATVRLLLRTNARLWSVVNLGGEFSASAIGHQDSAGAD